ncbi:hypothetical protein EYF80_025243 [Liparis tanakae]|uniref:Uncharacterized protein n=1 Tax=Liparis tanakae TaxID=230148 RepID=A0A4Z2HGW2_9TELE|nr:hypothetical protein EYF80_025243 [Liparis tanakae]
MSSRLGSSGVNVSGRVGAGGSEGTGEEKDASFKAARPGPRSADSAAEGRPSGAERLGRKARGKSCRKDGRGRRREGNQDGEEERQSVEHAGHVGDGERGKRPRGKAERTGTRGDGARQETGSTESLSSSNSDSDNLQRGCTCPRCPSAVCTQTTGTDSNPQFPRSAMRSMSSSALSQPPVQTRPTPPSPLRLSSRTGAGNLHRHPLREADPFRMEVRTGASQSRQARIPSLISSDRGEEEEEEEEDLEDGEEGGSGVMEVLGRTVTSAAVPTCVPFGMRKREKNRIKCLRRRRRRKERWRQESRQVNGRMKRAPFRRLLRIFVCSKKNHRACD